MSTILMKVSPKVHRAVMCLARKKHKRAGQILESLIPPAVFEEASLNSEVSDVDADLKTSKLQRTKRPEFDQSV